MPQFPTFLLCFLAQPFLEEGIALPTVCEKYPLRDMHGQYIKDIEYNEAVQHVREGVAKSYGTRKTIVGYQLTVSLERVAGYEYAGRSLVPANFAGTRYIFRVQLSTEAVNSYLFRYKTLIESDSPQYGLLRILTAPALESEVYTPRSEATETERAKDPGKARRQDVAQLFHAVVIPRVRYHDRSLDDDAPRWQPLWFTHLKTKIRSRPAAQPPWAVALTEKRALEQQAMTVNLN